MQVKATLAIVLSSSLLLAAGSAYAGPYSTHTHDTPKKCMSLVTLKHLPSKAERKAEYNKCMQDPDNYN